LTELLVRTEADMLALGSLLARACAPGSVVYLQGALGVGKTTWVRGFLRGLGYQGTVKSPTFTLVEPYEARGTRVYHLDLYRLSGPDELEDLGVRDYFDDEAICLVEWPERGRDRLPAADVAITMAYAEPGTVPAGMRRVRLEGRTVRGQGCVSQHVEGKPAA
jgi:tRNA threonylcarbamoyladenosine biosynthesis protein TsaE